MFVTTIVVPELPLAIAITENLSLRTFMILDNIILFESILAALPAVSGHLASLGQLLFLSMFWVEENLEVFKGIDDSRDLIYPPHLLMVLVCIFKRLEVIQHKYLI